MTCGLPCIIPFYEARRLQKIWRCFTSFPAESDVELVEFFAEIYKIGRLILNCLFQLSITGSPFPSAEINLSDMSSSIG